MSVMSEHAHEGASYYKWMLTSGNGIFDVLHLDDVAQKHATSLVRALDVVKVVVVKADSGRADHPQASLELHRLQLLRVTRLRSDGAHLRWSVSYALGDVHLDDLPWSV